MPRDLHQVYESLYNTFSASTTHTTETRELAVTTSPSFEYVITPQNFKKIVKQGKRFDTKLMKFAQLFEPFVDQKFKEALTLYSTLHGCIDYMEYHVNDRLKEMTTPNLEKLKTALEKDRDNIMELSNQKILNSRH